MDAERSWRGVIGFGSSKGGVGKSTVALLFADQLARTLEGPPFKKYKRVVLVDADVVGTDLAVAACHGTSDPFVSAQTSVSDVLMYMPDGPEARDFERWLQEEIVAPVEKDKRVLVRSFPDGLSLHRERELAKAFERSSTFVRSRLERLLRVLRDAGALVVVDLPAFHVGFCELARDAIRAVEGNVCEVVGMDVRDWLALARDKASVVTPVHPRHQWVIANHVILSNEDGAGLKDVNSLFDVQRWIRGVVKRAAMAETRVMSLLRLAYAPAPPEGAIPFNLALDKASGRVKYPVRADEQPGPPILDALRGDKAMIEAGQKLVGLFRPRFKESTTVRKPRSTSSNG